MTYLNYNGDRTFKDQTVSCGEYQNRACGIGGSVCRPNQNSVQLLNERLGIADLIAPTLGITSPQDGATVEPGFAVDAMASDNVAVTQATLLVDDEMVDMAPGAGPYSFATDAMLAEGPHSITVEVVDGHGNKQHQTISVTVAKAGTGTGSDTDGDDGTGSDTDGDGVPDGGDGGAVDGGCSSTNGGGLAFGLFAAAGLVLQRRRRYR
jgi:uncharacterized protein (TIGR03382 family)